MLTRLIHGAQHGSSLCRDFAHPGIFIKASLKRYYSDITATLQRRRQLGRRKDYARIARTSMDYTIVDLLIELAERQASDLHVTVGVPPTLRVHGRLIRLDLEALTPEDTRGLAFSIMR